MENKSFGRLMIVTGLKLIGISLMCLFIMFTLAIVVYNMTFNVDLMLLAFMGGFFIGMLIFVFTYPIIFKSYKIHWEEKQKQKELEKELLCEKEVRNKLQESKEIITENKEMIDLKEENNSVQ